MRATLGSFWYLRFVFTGLVETTAELGARERRGPGYRLAIKTALSGLSLGESVAVSGACLTVVSSSNGGFEADVSSETAARTTLGRLALGSELNLERSLEAGGRLGGHIVTGHVDAVATVSELERVGDALRVRVSAPRELMRYVAEKGSVALDGVSLTVNAVSAADFEVMLIPHTLAITNLKGLEVGTPLNLEIDLLARYVVRWLETADASGPKPSSFEQALRRSGIL